ncbi:pilin [Vibrio aestuarianus]|uniref:Pilin n=1 Tax=Vibrio aestuarianus TaxID=28171 RepID=A0A9X4F9A6_9VIBR|nr:pilin [Vibrio aestuarianus]MDE1235091.1 pilin [Vibrio aestuarianus]MDE1245917.1 pilin [Vibrio aestuarianus]MDE1264274.1 pilin [Vibrio aestuarianus]MDE1296309.1 pilin [Vibrio aestuarianus]MDE1335946.1 pilin [Vibrio aestuarianus]
MNTNGNSKQNGFTLIELMIVVAIIGVLSAIAVPAYQNYVKKSEVASGVATLKSLVTLAELEYQDHSTVVSMAVPTSQIGTIAVSGATGITLTFNNTALGTVAINRDSTSGWLCSITGLTPSSAAPTSCPAN